MNCKHYKEKEIKINENVIYKIFHSQSANWQQYTNENNGRCPHYAPHSAAVKSVAGKWQSTQVKGGTKIVAKCEL